MLYTYHYSMCIEYKTCCWFDRLQFYKRHLHFILEKLKKNIISMMNTSKWRSITLFKKTKFNIYKHIRKFDFDERFWLNMFLLYLLQCIIFISNNNHWISMQKEILLFSINYLLLFHWCYIHTYSIFTSK